MCSKDYSSIHILNIHDFKNDDNNNTRFLIVCNTKIKSEKNLKLQVHSLCYVQIIHLQQ